MKTILKLYQDEGYSADINLYLRQVEPNYNSNL